MCLKSSRSKKPDTSSEEDYQPHALEMVTVVHVQKARNEHRLETLSNNVIHVYFESRYLRFEVSFSEENLST